MKDKRRKILGLIYFMFSILILTTNSCTRYQNPEEESHDSSCASWQWEEAPEFGQSDRPRGY